MYEDDFDESLEETDSLERVDSSELRMDILERFSLDELKLLCSACNLGTPLPVHEKDVPVVHTVLTREDYIEWAADRVKAKQLKSFSQMHNINIWDIVRDALAALGEAQDTNLL